MGPDYDEGYDPEGYEMPFGTIMRFCGVMGLAILLAPLLLHWLWGFLQYVVPIAR